MSGLASAIRRWMVLLSMERFCRGVVTFIEPKARLSTVLVLIAKIVPKQMIFTWKYEREKEGEKVQVNKQIGWEHYRCSSVDC